MRWRALAVYLVLVLAGCSSSGSKEKSKEDLAGLYADMALGYMQRQPPEYDRAKERIEKALEADPKMVRVHHYAAELYARTEDYEKAEYHFRHALELAPRDPNLKNNFGVFLCARERFPEAERQFLAAINDPAYATPQLAYENLGRCALRVPDAAKAERYFNEALKRQSNLPTSLYHMAKLQYDRRDYFKARAYLERYLGVGAASAPVLLLGFRIEQALGDSAMAARYADELRSKFPESDEAAQLTDPAAEPTGAAGRYKDKPLEVLVSEEVMGGAAKASTPTAPPPAHMDVQQTSPAGADGPE